MLSSTPIPPTAAKIEVLISSDLVATGIERLIRAVKRNTRTCRIVTAPQHEQACTHRVCSVATRSARTCATRGQRCCASGAHIRIVRATLLRVARTRAHHGSNVVAHVRNIAARRVCACATRTQRCCSSCAHMRPKGVALRRCGCARAQRECLAATQGCALSHAKTRRHEGLIFAMLSFATSREAGRRQTVRASHRSVSAAPGCSIRRRTSRARVKARCARASSLLAKYASPHACAASASPQA